MVKKRKLNKKEMKQKSGGVGNAADNNLVEAGCFDPGNVNCTGEIVGAAQNTGSISGIVEGGDFKVLKDK